jgi:hypothetical protein
VQKLKPPPKSKLVKVNLPLVNAPTENAEIKASNPVLSHDAPEQNDDMEIETVDVRSVESPLELPTPKKSYFPSYEYSMYALTNQEGYKGVSSKRPSRAVFINFAIFVTLFETKESDSLRSLVQVIFHFPLESQPPRQYVIAKTFPKKELLE